MGVSADLGESRLKESILHYAKGTKNFCAQHANHHNWGTVGSGLTPGSPLDRGTSEILVLSGSRAGKLKTIHQDDQWKNHEKLNFDNFFRFGQKWKKASSFMVEVHNKTVQKMKDLLQLV